MNPKAQLFLLKTGETLKAKAAELERGGVSIADQETIRLWAIGDHEPKDLKNVVIADPTAEPLRSLSADSLFVLIPVCFFNQSGKFFTGGAIDLDVPMWPKENGGQLAILGIVPQP